MKLILGVLLALSVPAFADSPFMPEIEKRFRLLEDANAGGTLASARLIVGSSGNIATARDITGDVTIGNTGVTAIGAGKVTSAMMEAPTTDGLNAKRTARAEFDFADGDLAVGANSLGISLPAKAIITRSYIYVQTQLVDTGTCTVAVSCEDANNIKTATDITGTAANAMIEGESTGAASAFKMSIAATCAITLTVADGGSCVPSAGKGLVFVEYVVHD